MLPRMAASARPPNRAVVRGEVPVRRRCSRAEPTRNGLQHRDGYGASAEILFLDPGARTLDVLEPDLRRYATRGAPDVFIPIARLRGDEQRRLTKIAQEHGQV